MRFERKSVHIRNKVENANRSLFFPERSIYYKMNLLHNSVDACIASLCKANLFGTKTMLLFV